MFYANALGFFFGGGFGGGGVFGGGGDTNHPYLQLRAVLNCEGYSSTCTVR